MGLFSSKKKTHVSSQTYSMAGNYKERMNFAKTNVVGAVLKGLHDKRGMGEVISGNYLSGPGIALRNAYGWLDRNDYWNQTSQSRTFVDSTSKVNTEVIRNNVPMHGGNYVYVEDVSIGYPSTEDLVYSHMLDKYPDFYKYLDFTDEELKAELQFSYNPSDDSNDLPSNTIEIEYKGTTELLKVPEDNDSLHVIISYSPYKTINATNTVKVDDFEPMYSWKLKTDTTVTNEYIKSTKIRYDEYSDGSIKESTVSISPIKFTVTKGVKVWEKYSLLGELQAIETHKYEEDVVSTKNIEEHTVPDPPDPIEGEEPKPVLVRSYTETITHTKVDPQKYVIISRIDGAKESLGNRIYIYKYGSGNASLDEVIKPTEVAKDSFFPIIPFRVNKRNIDSNYYNGIYKLNKSLYKRITSGQNYDDFIKEVSKSNGIGDINTGFMQIGVSLNTKEPESREYIYTFFKNLLAQNGVKPNEDSWVDEAINWSKWSYSEAKKKADSYNVSFSRPPTPTPSPAKTKRRERLSISTYGLGYSINFRYSSGKISTHKGVFRNLKKGEIHLDEVKSEGFSFNGYEPREFCSSGSHTTNCHWGVAKVGSYTPFGFDNSSPDRVVTYRIIKQVTDNSYEIISVYEVEHHNSIKDGKSISLYPFSHNDGGEESGCIIPLNPYFMRKMSLKDLTQMSMSCKHITFNAWKITKKKWYQTGLFKIVMVVVIIVVSIYFPPAGGAAGGSGMLGANAAIGASIGLAGTAAIVAGAAINAIAAMVVTSVLAEISTGIFGDKIGAIVGAVASFVVAGQISGMSNGMSFSEAFNGLLKSDNIMSLSKAVGKGYMGYQQSSTLDVLNRTQSMLDDMKKQIEDVNVKMQDEFSRQVVLDPLFLSDAFSDFIEGETRDEFISRTLMVGSDVVEISHNIVNNFAGLNLDLKL